MHPAAKHGAGREAVGGSGGDVMSYMDLIRADSTMNAHEHDVLTMCVNENRWRTILQTKLNANTT